MYVCNPNSLDFLYNLITVHCGQSITAHCFGLALPSRDARTTVQAFALHVKYELYRGSRRTVATEWMEQCDRCSSGDPGLCDLCGCTGQRSNKTRPRDTVIIPTHLLPIPVLSLTSPSATPAMYFGINPSVYHEVRHPLCVLWHN